MSDFEPTTDFPESIDDDDQIIESAARNRDLAIQDRRRTIMRVVAVFAAVVLMIVGFHPLRVVVAVLVAYGVLRVGLGIIGSFARPVPEPPPPGELRRVKLTYRCSICGSELRMTLANDQVPQAPRHCADEMDLTTAIEDL